MEFTVMGGSTSSQAKTTGDSKDRYLNSLKSFARGFIKASGASVFLDEFAKRAKDTSIAAAIKAIEHQANNNKLAKEALDALFYSMGKAKYDASAGAVGGCYEAFALANAPKAGAAELDSALAFGGCGCNGLFIGAADMDIAAVKGYSVSANASAKEALVNKLLDSLAEIGLKYDESATSSQEKLQSVINRIPKDFRSNASDHIKIINGMINAINKVFGENIINAGMSPEDSAKRILEVIHSLTSGMHSEYLMVYTDVITTIQNLRILIGALEDTIKRIDVRIKNSNVDKDSTLINLRTSVDLAIGECRRQLAMLEGLLNTTLTTADKSIASLIDKLSSTEDIEKFARVGDKQFGKTIHDILLGMGVTANLSIVINNALKKVGMTVDEYAKTSTVNQLLEKVEAQVHKLHDDAEAEEFFKAVKTLTSNLWRAHDFAKYKNQQAEVSGAAEYEDSPIEKQIKNRKNIRNLIFAAFNKKVQEAFNRLISTIDVLSIKIGTDVPVTTELDGFRSSLGRIDTNLVYHKNIYYALIGYYNDSLSKSKREEFLADLKVVKAQAEIVVDKPEFAASAGLFREVISSINGIIALIDQYTDEIAAKFGSDEVSDPDTGVSGGDDVDGGADSEELNIKPLTVAFKSVHNIHDAVTKFDYRFKVAQIRRNLKVTSAELSEYGKDYDKIVTNSIYEILAVQQKRFNALRAQFNEDKFGKVNDYVLAGRGGYSTDSEVAAQRDAAIKTLENRWNIKKKFWATVEAVDKYMQVFTDALATNPDDIQDIKTMLDGIEIIGDWYTDATGNNTAGVFDYFPRTILNSEPKYPDASYREGPGHYYSRIGAAYAGAAQGSKDNAAPGNPYLVADPVTGAKAIDQVKKTFEGLSVLKNLMSVFVHVGSKFGGEELRNKISMTPSQMYNNLVEYIQASSFSQGYGTVGNADKFKDDLPEHFDDSRIHSHLDVDVIAGMKVASGYSANAYGGPGATPQEDKIELFRHRWGVWMRSIYDKLIEREGFGFEQEDEYFVLMLKSLAAKIFTVVGTYDVFDRPLEFNGLSPIRMTIGGADTQVHIDEAITPLYLRLTLLAQFYRKVFSFTPIGDEEISGTKYDWKVHQDLPRTGTTVKISMVPDVMGTFAGFIRLMFRKVRGIDPENFSDDDIKDIVTEINSIYAKLKDKHSSDPIAGIIAEFVSEVNRRYAIVSKEERDAYEREFGARYDRMDTNASYDIDDRDAQMPLDIPLLPGEDEMEVTRLSEFQRRLDSVVDTKYDVKKSKFKITLDHRKLVNDFRCAIDKFFENPEDPASFDGPINNVQRKLKVETREDQRFKLVASLIRGTDAYTKIDGSKYVMFHECVVGQLNLLSAIHSMLARFKLIVQITDLKWLQKEFVSAVRVAGAVPVAPATPVAFADVFIAHIMDKLVVLRLVDKNTDPYALELIARVIGRGSNHVSTGGTSAADDYIIKEDFSVVSDINRSTYLNINAGNIEHRSAAGGAVDNQHLLGLLNGVPSADLDKPAHADKLQTVYRYFFDHKFVMKLLIESIFGITADLQGLVQISWDRNKLSINAGGLKKLVLELFDSVNYFIDALRPQLDKNFVNAYTHKTTAGSLYWLQEQLIEKIIEGREPGKNAAGVDMPKYDSLERVMQTLSNTYRELTREWQVNGKNLSNAAASRVSSVTSERESYDKVFASMIFYDGSAPESAIASESVDAATKVSTETATLVDYLHNPHESLHFMGPQGSQVIDTRYIHRFQQLYNFNKTLTGNRSALFMFNQLVAKFIESCYDSSTQKIYSPLLSQFTNGLFSRGVTDHTYTYPDTVPAYFLKFHPGENVVTSNENNFKALIKPEFSDDLPILADIIKTYLDYLPAGDATIPPRHDRFNLSANGLASVVHRLPPPPPPAAPPAAVYPVSKLYALLLIAAAAKVMHGLFITNTVTDARLQVGPSDLLNFFQVAYPGVTAVPADTSINAIMKELLSRGLGVVYDLAAFTHAVPDMRAAITDTNLDGHANDSSIGTGMFYTYASANRASEAFRYLRTFDRYLTLNPHVNKPDDFATIPTVVANKFPYRVPVGASNVEVNFAADAYAGLAMAIVSKRAEFATLYKDAGAAGNAGEQNKIMMHWEHLLGELFKANAGPQAYVPPTAVQPKIDAKRDDLIGAVTEDFLGAFRAPNMHSDYIIVARDEQLAGALKPDSIKNLPGTSGNPGSLVSGLGQNGVASGSINAVLKFGNRMDPDGEHVLFTSLANILKTLYQSRNSTQGTVYLQESIADVAMYMKEKYRASLPVFKNLFSELRHKCEFIKKLLEQNELNLTRDFKVITPTHNPWPYVLHTPTTSDADTKTRFGGILDTIIQGCNTIMTSCDQVLREVGDDPKYFETYGGSIRDYKSQYGVEPFMPITSMLHLLANSDSDNANLVVPVHGMGQEQFKLSYGFRGLLSSLQSEPTIESVPGFANIVEQFNILLDPKMQVSKEHCDKFVKTFIKGLRFVYESKHLKGNVTPFIANVHYNHYNAGDRMKYASGLFTRQDLVDTTGALLTNKSLISMTTSTGAKTLKPVYAINKKLSDVLRLTESSDKDARIRELVEYMRNDPAKRRNKEIQNIIDLNIVPINIHALRREIPLINLYNYAYTFDRMIIELYYGLRSEQARKLIADLCDGKSANITSAKDMLVSLLINPYHDLRPNGDNLWNSHTKGMLVGVSSDPELGRPKFLSDQIYNKAVFGEMYVSELDRNEMGPPAAEIHNRKPTKDSVLVFVTNIVNMFAKPISINNGAITLNAANIDKYSGYVRGVIKAIVDNPTTHINDMIKKVSESSSKSTAIIGLTQRHDELAQITCAWAKLALIIGVYMSNKIVNENLDDPKITDIVDDVLYPLATHCVAVFGNKNAKPLRDDILSKFVPPLNPLHPVLNDILDKFVYDMTYPATAAAAVAAVVLGITNGAAAAPGRPAALPYNAVSMKNDINRMIRPTVYEQTGQTSHGPKYLHWLDVEKVHPRDRTQLSGVQDKSESHVHSEDVTEINSILAVLGRARFDTRFIRNLIFIVNLFRSVRVKLQRDLTYSRDIIQRSAPITRNPITEFTGNDVDANQARISSVAWDRY